MVSESKGLWFNLPSFMGVEIRFSASLARVLPLFTSLTISMKVVAFVQVCALPRKCNMGVLIISEQFSFLLF